MSGLTIVFNPPDKTEVFHAQIEVKQKDLEPWSAKINKKQAELDIATNERNMLAEKASAVKDSVADAAKALERLVVDKDAKVRRSNLGRRTGVF